MTPPLTAPIRISLEIELPYKHYLREIIHSLAAHLRRTILFSLKML